MAISSPLPNPAADRGCWSCRSHWRSSPTPGSALHAPDSEAVPPSSARHTYLPSVIAPGVFGRLIDQGWKNFLYFFPLPHGQDVLRPIFIAVQSSCGLSRGSPRMRDIRLRRSLEDHIHDDSARISNPLKMGAGKPPQTRAVHGDGSWMLEAAAMRASAMKDMLSGVLP